MHSNDDGVTAEGMTRWARNRIDRLVYDGTRPLSICSTVEAATREAAIAFGNAIAHSAEIAEIESVSAYVCERLKAERPPG